MRFIMYAPAFVSKDFFFHVAVSRLGDSRADESRGLAWTATTGRNASVTVSGFRRLYSLPEGFLAYRVRESLEEEER